MFRQKIESEIQNLQGRSFNSVGSEGRFVTWKRAKVILTHFFPSRGKNSFEQAILSDLERIEDQYGRLKIELNGQKSGVEVNIFLSLELSDAFFNFRSSRDSVKMTPNVFGTTSTSSRKKWISPKGTLRTSTTKTSSGFRICKTPWTETWESWSLT